MPTNGPHKHCGLQLVLGANRSFGHWLSGLLKVHDITHAVAMLRCKIRVSRDKRTGLSGERSASGASDSRMDKLGKNYQILHLLSTPIHQPEVGLGNNHLGP
jgi:hypothetical protein